MDTMNQWTQEAKWLGPLAAFLSSVTWALGASAYTRLSQKYPAYLINFSRACVAAPVFLFMALIQDSTLILSISNLLNNTVTSAEYLVPLFWFTLSVVGSYGVGDLFFLTSAKSIGVPAALAIASAYPLWSTLCGYLFQDERLRLIQYGGVGVVVLGVIVVILNRQSQNQRASSDNHSNRKWLNVKKPANKHSDNNKQATGIVPVSAKAGVFCAVATSMFWALNTFALSKGGKGINPLTANFIRMTIAIILCPLIGYILLRFTKSKNLLVFRIELKDWVKSIPIFLIEGVGGSFFFLYGITHSSLAVGAALTSLAPAVAYLIALATKNEKKSFGKFMGISLVLLGIYFLLLQ